ncbi:MAG: 3-isopropylmalate dehydratase large subunit [Alphaproteobacteria bacterium]|jgi:3-isopropylmalate/(R)-2-methylmalate dehydratase large subunit|nr:3-isopropylmalate dehydratase large subunit [Alphaproteobacteria bacterium]MDP6816880.1 3-isopropylmalate dehydratase large subunit [Alphaproteobacteria bacterium]
MGKPRTIIEKIWRAHAIHENDRGETLLFVDRHYLEEASVFAFEDLRQAKRPVRRPDLTYAVADHLVPTRGRPAGPSDPELSDVLARMRRYTSESGVEMYDQDDPRQGIIHVIAPELGLSLPGAVIACGDSHTATHGALGALALSIGASEATHVLATQSLWQSAQPTLRLTVEGALPPGTVAKDLMLTIIARIGNAGAVGHIVEYAGSAIRGLSMEGRMTLCNMSAEAGARAGLIAPDQTTFDYVAARPHAPKGDAWRAALAHWRELPSDEGAAFDKEIRLDAGDVAPRVTWGTSPEESAPVDGHVPALDEAADADQQQRLQAALDYMGLEPGMAVSGIKVDRVFIGSCTNSRIEDLRAAAEVAASGKAVIPVMVVPGSGSVKRQAEAEGLDRIFLSAGFEWLDAGCSMCVGMNGDRVAPGQRCASTSNRNFVGRQGPGARTHLMSPAMAAGAALHGRITDIRKG